MANCDFGSPCDCRECRTAHRNESCAACGFVTTVEIEGTVTFGRDRKGIRTSEQVSPDGPDMSLACWKCGAVKEGVRFYTAVATSTCVRRAERERLEVEARPCDGCGTRVEGYPDRAITLREHDSKQLCVNCIAAHVERTTPDPSTSDAKYSFNRRTLKWEEYKRRVACSSCGKARWLNIGNEWKKVCGPCYRANA